MSGGSTDDKDLEYRWIYIYNTEIEPFHLDEDDQLILLQVYKLKKAHCYCYHQVLYQFLQE